MAPPALLLGGSRPILLGPGVTLDLFSPFGWQGKADGTMHALHNAVACLWPRAEYVTKRRRSKARRREHHQTQGSVQDPNVDDPLNKEAAQMMSQDRSKFERLVKLSITRGQEINGTYFPPCKV